MLIRGGTVDDGQRVPLGFTVEEFSTGSAEAATVSLRDGSVVRLGPQSQLRVLPGEARRVVLRGRAYFAVARNAPNTFRIEVAGSEIEVLGTRFEVQSDGDDLRVAVLEGQVAISSRGRRTELSEGELLRVLQGVAMPVVPIPDDFTMSDWSGLFLAFQDTPIAVAAKEITAMYGVPLKIAEPAIGDHTITAWFVDQPLDHVLRVFCLIAAADCDTAADGAVHVTPAVP
jgi:transmembrane sensor